MYFKYVLRWNSTRKFQPNVGQPVGAWKTLQKASVSLPVVSKGEESPCLILPPFRGSEAVLSCLHMFPAKYVYYLGLFREDLRFSEYLRAIKAANGNTELEFLVFS